MKCTLFFLLGLLATGTIFSRVPFSNLPRWQANARIIENKQNTQPQNDLWNRKMKYLEWSQRFAQVFNLINRIVLNDALRLEQTWLKAPPEFVFQKSGPSVLQITLFPSQATQVLTRYLLIPWQDFSLKNVSEDVPFSQLFLQLYAVTDFAVIYESLPPQIPSAAEAQAMQRFQQVLNDLTSAYRVEQESFKNGNFPEHLQRISSRFYPYYSEIQVAIPGSRLQPFETELRPTSHRMLFVHWVPDRGPVHSIWLSPKADSTLSVYYLAAEDSLLSLFEQALTQALEKPADRATIYGQKVEQLQRFFRTAENEAQEVFKQFRRRLYRWLLLDERGKKSFNSGPFADYTPKRTPDTVLDFRPDLRNDILKIPAAQLNHLPQLLSLMEIYQEEARSNPGKWVEGNVVLGAPPHVYEPTAAELMVSEIGERVQVIVQAYGTQTVKRYLQKHGVSRPVVRFLRFRFEHVDVMGSGRFYYVDEMKEVTLTF